MAGQTPPAQTKPRSWKLPLGGCVCPTCGNRYAPHFAYCQAGHPKVPCLGETVEAISLEEVVKALEDYFDPQAHRSMHPADFITKRYEMPGHEGLEYV